MAAWGQGRSGKRGRGLSSSLLPLKVTGQRIDVHRAWKSHLCACPALKPWTLEMVYPSNQEWCSSPPKLLENAHVRLLKRIGPNLPYPWHLASASPPQGSLGRGALHQPTWHLACSYHNSLPFAICSTNICWVPTTHTVLCLLSVFPLDSLREVSPPPPGPQIFWTIAMNIHDYCSANDCGPQRFVTLKYNHS